MGNNTRDGNADSSRLTYATDGWLLARVVHNGCVHALQGYDILILDEVHNRSRAMELLIQGLSGSIASSSRPIQTVMMSATLGTERFQRLFPDSILHRLQTSTPFAIQFSYLQKPVASMIDDPTRLEATMAKIQEIINGKYTQDDSPDGDATWV